LRFISLHCIALRSDVTSSRCVVRARCSIALASSHVINILARFASRADIFRVPSARFLFIR
jgi:hypothetical protein